MNNPVYNHYLLLIPFCGKQYPKRRIITPYSRDWPLVLSLL